MPYFLFVTSAETQDIRIEVESRYVEERSSPSENFYFFSYHIRISNRGPMATQLLSRQWIITDADGQVEEVRGPGVVGEQPVLAPFGGSFEYTSFCPLSTPVGSMEGSYVMQTSDGSRFEARIPAFTLAVPTAVN